MATYTKIYTLALGEEGLALRAQLQDSLGGNVGSPLTTGYVDKGNGNYTWILSNDSAFLGVWQFSDLATNEVLGEASVNIVGGTLPPVNINTVDVIDAPAAGDFALISLADGRGPFRAPAGTPASRTDPMTITGPYAADAATLDNQIIAGLVTLGMATDDRTDNPHTILMITDGGGGTLLVACDGPVPFATASVVLTGTGDYDGGPFTATTTGAPANSFLVTATYTVNAAGGAWAEA